MSLCIYCKAIPFKQLFPILLQDQILMCLSDDKDLSHSQAMTGSVARSLNEIDTFGKGTESTIFRVAATEFSKSAVALKFS